jgi:hypothetical protein
LGEVAACDADRFLRRDRVLRRLVKEPRAVAQARLRSVDVLDRDRVFDVELDQAACLLRAADLVANLSASPARSKVRPRRRPRVSRQRTS